MNQPVPERREELLDLAAALASQLRQVAVTRPTSGDEEIGIPKSVMGHARSLLTAARDREAFMELLRRFDDLDQMTAQNAANPKADHHVLHRELLRFLADQPDLVAGEVLYVLAWVQRFLPDRSMSSRGKRERQPNVTTPKPPSGPEPPGPMAAAFQKAFKKGKRDGGSS